jgi:hypothetical protein
MIIHPVLIIVLNVGNRHACSLQNEKYIISINYGG